METLPIKDLKKVPIWINWNLENKDGKTTKIPKAFDGTAVGTTQNYKQKWCDFETAKVQIADNSADGIGLIFDKITLDNKTFALAGIDIDHRDLEDIVVQDIISLMNTYTERSPSGNGFHLLILIDTTKLPENFKEIYYMKNPHNKIEAYVAELTNRFFTFTENVIVDKPIFERTQQFMQFLNTYMHRDINFSNADEVTECNDTLIKDNPVPQNNQIIVDTILRTKQADKFYKLFFEGDTSEYGGDNSSADMALATILAFYVGPNTERIDNLMKQSKLYRTKWERPDYKEMTIKKAIQCCNENFFDWRNEEISEESYSKAMIESLTAEELIQLNLPPLTPVVKELLYPRFINSSWCS